MNTNEPEWSDKAIEFALGIMPEAEQRFFAARMMSDKKLRDEVLAIQDFHKEALGTIDYDFDAPDFSKEILARIRTEGSSQRKNRVRPYWMWIAASVALGIAGTFGIRNWIEREVVNALHNEMGKNGSPISLESVGEASGNDLNTRLVLSPLTRPGDQNQPSDTLSIGEQKLMQLTVVSESIWDLVGLDEPVDGSVQRGYILMDMDNKRGYLAIDDLENPENQILHIWIQLENLRAPVFAGLLPHLNENKGLLYFDFSEALKNYGNRSIKNVFVTGEVEVNKVKPRGEILLKNS